MSKSRLSRDEFAARALTGMLARPASASVYSCVEIAFEAADEMLTLSAPDAIEALDALIAAGDTWMDICDKQQVQPGTGSERIAFRRALVAAETVFTRYREIKE